MLFQALAPLLGSDLLKVLGHRISMKQTLEPARSCPHAEACCHASGTRAGLAAVVHGPQTRVSHSHAWTHQGPIMPSRHAGATIAAAPVLVLNLLAPEYTQSLAALLVGFALSEMWRAPAAVMVRDVSPPSLGSTGSAVHLCIRNFVGGLGPLGRPLAVHSRRWYHVPFQTCRASSFTFNM